jgi:3-oxoacyl-[acyl-carrier protein] reductase
MARLSGKVALVTGGTRGIGRAIAAAYAREGANVMVSGGSAASIARADVQAMLGERVAAVAGDLADAATPTQLVAATVARFGRLDVLVNNAGIGGSADFWGTSATQWDEVMAVNLRAAFLLARAAADRMRESGGAIVNVSSVAGQIGGAATGPAYVASKAALIGLTKSIARHTAAFQVRVNCIAPADIETDMTAAWTPELRARLVAMTPLGRFGTPAEVAELAVYLAEDASAFVTGQTFNVNGGLYMG